MNESTLVPREEMSDLDWLARNVHVWNYSSDSCYVSSFNSGRRGASSAPHTVIYSEVMKSQWLSRRAELQNKPSWADAPAWAMFLIQTKSGLWLWLSHKPNDIDDNGVMYFGPDANSAKAIEGEVIGDWRDTLEKRPDAHKLVSEMPQEGIEEIKYVMPKNWAELESFVNAGWQSKMPSHSNQPKPSNDIQECAEVKQFEPFVSVEDAATAKQQAPKGSGNPILGMVLADLTNRALEGKEKYGEPLLAHNGRNPLWDAYQEALDLAMYLRQAIEEQK